jgi:hypothetical protein
MDWLDLDDELDAYDDGLLLDDDGLAFDAEAGHDDSFERIATMLRRGALRLARGATTRAAPPPISFGEVTVADREPAIVAQLGHFARYGWQRPGQNVRGAQPGRQGLAVLDPASGRVTYTVIDPRARAVVYRRTIGTAPAAARSGGQALEDYVRGRLPELQRLAGVPQQPFRWHRVEWGGPDLLPPPRRRRP